MLWSSFCRQTFVPILLIVIWQDICTSICFPALPLHLRILKARDWPKNYLFGVQNVWKWLISFFFNNCYKVFSLSNELTILLTLSFPKAFESRYDWYLFQIIDFEKVVFVKLDFYPSATSTKGMKNSISKKTWNLILEHVFKRFVVLSIASILPYQNMWRMWRESTVGNNEKVQMFFTVHKWLLHFPRDARSVSSPDFWSTVKWLQILL